MTTTTTEAPQGVFVSPAEFAATAAKVEKINARAARKGFTGRVTLTYEPAEISHTNALGFRVTETGYRVVLGGEAPSYNGSRLLAALDIEEGGFIVRTAPGVESIDRSTLRPGYCDHCKTERPRNRTFVVETADGTQVQVGSTCIKDYLGWSTSIAFISTSEVSEEIGFGGFGGGDRAYSVDTVLAVAWAATSALGFVPSSGFGLTTRAITHMVLAGPTRQESETYRAEIDAVRDRAAESADRAAEIKAFILSDEFSGSSEYVQNLKVLCSGTVCGGRNLGFLASAPQAHLRHLGQVAERQADTSLNEHVGQVGDKVEVTLTIKSIRYIAGNYGTTTLYTMADAEGRTFKWFSSNQALGTDEGATFALKGTIKAHDEYQGRKATVLTRCKVIEEVTA